jgi:hypothetical protein
MFILGDGDRLRFVVGEPESSDSFGAGTQRRKSALAPVATREARTDPERDRQAITRTGNEAITIRDSWFAEIPRVGKSAAGIGKNLAFPRG